MSAVKVRQVALLSTLIIDLAKDWGGHKIVNLGAPTGAGEALRYGDEGLIDHDSLLNYVASKHLTLPAAIAAVLTDHTKAVHDALAIDADLVDGEHAAAIVTDARVKAHFPDTLANVLSDHNLAGHPLAIIPTMDDAHVPDLSTLSGFPATDPAAGTGGLRTLGTGAQQAAAGNHTHTLAEDTTGTAEADSVTPDEGTYYYLGLTVKLDEEPYDASVTPTFHALARAVAVGTLTGASAYASSMKLRVYMGGVLVSESGYVPTGFHTTVLVGTRNLSGAQLCKVTVRGYRDPSTVILVCSYNSSMREPMGIGVGSVKP